MGIWQTLGKLIQGKPVFEVSDQVKSSGPPVDTSTGHSHEPKLIPRLEISRVKTQLSGGTMAVWGFVHNSSPVSVRLDKMVMIGATRRLGNFLSPGETEQVELYRGVVPQSESYGRAELHFMQRDTGDYFCADFVIRYDYHADGHYLVESLDAYDYVRDV